MCAAGGAPRVDRLPVSVRLPPGPEHCAEAAGQGCSVSSQPACNSWILGATAGEPTSAKSWYLSCRPIADRPAQYALQHDREIVSFARPAATLYVMGGGNPVMRHIHKSTFIQALGARELAHLSSCLGGLGPRASAVLCLSMSISSTGRIEHSHSSMPVIIPPAERLVPSPMS